MERIHRIPHSNADGNIPFHAAAACHISPKVRLGLFLLFVCVRNISVQRNDSCAKSTVNVRRASLISNWLSLVSSQNNWIEFYIERFYFGRNTKSVSLWARDEVRSRVKRKKLRKINEFFFILFIRKVFSILVRVWKQFYPLETTASFLRQKENPQQTKVSIFWPKSFQFLANHLHLFAEKI